MGKVSLALCALGVTAVLALDQPAVPTWSTTGTCTDKSLTIPGWLISNFKTSGTLSSFAIVNRASEVDGAQAKCTSDGKCTITGNDKIQASISVQSGFPLVNIKDSWVCTDSGESIAFTGSGQANITACQGSNCTSPIPYLATAALSLPVSLRPTLQTPASGFDVPTCAKAGEGLWTVSNVVSKHYTVDQCTDLESGVCFDDPRIEAGYYISLDIANNAIGQSVHCDSLTQVANNGVLRCTGNDLFNQVTLDMSFIGAKSDFNLTIQQLWYCGHETPVSVLATGESAYHLDCVDTVGTTGQADDVVSTCTISEASRSVAGQASIETLPSFALVTKPPQHGGCSYDTIVNPYIDINYFYWQANHLSSDPNTTTLEDLNMVLEFPGIFGTYNVQINTDFPPFGDPTPILSGSGLDAVADCSRGENDGFVCNANMNPYTDIFTLTKGWKCSDQGDTFKVQTTISPNITTAPNGGCAADGSSCNMDEHRFEVISISSFDVNSGKFLTSRQINGTWISI